MQIDLTRWRIAPSFPNYEVHETGLVRRRISANNVKAGQILKPQVDARRPYNNTSYAHHILTRDGVKQKVRVHRLVLEAFVGFAPTPLHEGNHLDGNGLNNHVTNLEWVTRGENIHHAFATGLRPYQRGELGPRAKLTSADVQAIRAAPVPFNQSEWSRRLGVCRATIQNVRSGRTWPEA